MSTITNIQEWTSSTSAYRYLSALDLNPKNLSEVLSSNFSAIAANLQEEVLMGLITSLTFGISSYFFLPTSFATASVFGAGFSIFSPLIGRVTKSFMDSENPSLQSIIASSICKIAGATLLGVGLTNTFGFSLSLLAALKIEVISLASILAAIPLLSIGTIISAFVITIVLTLVVVFSLAVYDFGVSLHHSIRTQFIEWGLVPA